MPNKEIAKTESVPKPLRKQKGPIIFIALSFIIVASVTAGYFYIKSKTDFVEYKNVKIGNEVFKLEIADTESARQLGLSNRDSLAKNEGMLFDFKQEGDWLMWMANMRFNIDIAWLTKDGEIIYIKSNLTPGSYPDAYHPNQNSWYVIEIPANSFDRINLKVGDKLKLN